MVARSALLILLLAASLLQGLPHRHHQEMRERIAFYKEHPELVFRACGPQILRIAKAIIEECDKIGCVRDVENRAHPRAESISTACCKIGCTYEYIRGQLYGAPKGLQKVLGFRQIRSIMASSRAFTLILLLVSLNLGESMWEKLDKVKEQVNIAFHKKNPDTLVRACGDQLLALLMEIDTSRCPTGRNRRAAGDERAERRRRSITHHCCRAGCSYASLTEMMCAQD